MWALLALDPWHWKIDTYEEMMLGSNSVHTAEILCVIQWWAVRRYKYMEYKKNNFHYFGNLEDQLNSIRWRYLEHPNKALHWITPRISAVSSNEWSQRVAGWVSASIFLSPSEYWLRLKLPTKMEFQAIEQLDNGHSLLVLHGPQLQ